MKYLGTHRGIDESSLALATFLEQQGQDNFTFLRHGEVPDPPFVNFPGPSHANGHCEPDPG